LPEPIRAADADEDGAIDLRELLDAMKRAAARAGPATRPGGRPDPAERFKQMDRDGDGKITKSEVPPQMQQHWKRMDANGDGVVDQQEQAAIIKRMRQGFRN
jgi:Ca2+-binding EF-hand superfamily protein